MRIRLTRTAPLAALIAIMTLSVACASSGAAGSSAAAPAATDTCFNASMATSFDYLQPRYGYVTVVGDKHFLLTFAQECIQLNSAMNISIRSRFEQVCSDSMDSIVFLAFGHPHYCRIIQIDPVKDRAAAEALVAERTGAAKSAG